MTAGIAALADPGTKTDIFAHLLRLAEPGYVKHLCSKLPGSYIAYAGMRLKDCYSRTMTLATEYLTKFGFCYSHFFGKELVLIEILIKAKPQFSAYI